MPVAAVVALLVAAGAWLIGQSLGSSSAPAHAKRSAKPALIKYQDPAGAFTGEYPAGWRRLQSGAHGVVVLVTGPGGASLEVRETALGGPVGDLRAAKNIADGVVKSGKNVKLIRQPQQVTLGGLPGLLYLYTFEDPTTGEQGAHAHYFLFQGTSMITLVFQALPANRILSLAPLFDRLANTFRATST